ncbi:hypothetical protein DSO57_1029056 [Entomophthora muscae]|uniref:Uncharacterized protein n=1 Tax=Entomophthora muscae TaxID=34485 RepID=A0ACC2TZS6_9FUNG|nr:hypothetical protein DSO57_1029056 [Entomophthora muscae]
MVDAITHWHHHLQGAQSSLWSSKITKPLCYFCKPQKLLPCQAQVMQTLSEYKFWYELQKGKLNISWTSSVGTQPCIQCVVTRDPFVTLIPASQVTSPPPTPGDSFPTQVVGLTLAPPNRTSCLRPRTLFHRYTFGPCSSLSDSMVLQAHS